MKKIPIEAYVLEPREILSEAIIGFDEVLIYSYEKLIDCFCLIFQKENEDFELISREWVDFNIVGNPEIILVYDE